MAQLVDSTQIIGKTLVAAKTVYMYSYPESKQEYYLYKISPGTTIGEVYSYVKRNGVTWWMFDLPNGKKGYVIHSKDAFSFEVLKQQGTQTVQEQEEAKKEEEKTVVEKTIDRIGEFIPKLLIGVGIFLLAKEVIVKKI